VRVEVVSGVPQAVERASLLLPTVAPGLARVGDPASTASGRTRPPAGRAEPVAAGSERR